MIRNLAILGGFALLFAGVFWMTADTSSAQSIVDTCKEEGTKCYEKEIPSLYPEKTLTEVFAIIREIRRLDPAYQFCHVSAHKLGEEAVAEDPMRWIDLIPQNPMDGVCSNGFIHGIIVGKFRNDVLDEATMEKTIPDFARACEPRPDWKPSPLDQAICYHAMGHLFMFITNADISRSLDTCERIGQSPRGDFRRVCREGVFMQIYQPLEPDDFALIELLPEEPSRENYRRMCAVHGRDAAEEGACLREAWPLFREDLLFKGGAGEFCSGHPDIAEETACYEAVFAITGRQLLGKESEIVTACEAAPDNRKDLCFLSAAQAFLEESRTDGSPAISVCAHAGSRANTCYTALAQRAVWNFGTNEEMRANFCAKLPNEYRVMCEGR
jgi:hypothetical protein